MSLDVAKIQQEFFQQLPGLSQVAQLFPKSSGVYWFIKDLNGTIVAANQLTVERCGCKEEADIIGKTDYDFFSKDLADKYVHDDRKVMEEGEPIFDMPELAPNKEGFIHCYNTTKIPLFDTNGKIIGMSGSTTSVEFFRQAIHPYLEILESVNYIKSNFRQNLSIPQLAEMVNLNIRKFESRFKEVFGITPQSYIIKMRLHEACVELLKSKKSISEIATGVGFYDHSTFTRQFSKHMEIKPVQYRKKYKKLKIF